MEVSEAGINGVIVAPAQSFGNQGMDRHFAAQTLGRIDAVALGVSLDTLVSGVRSSSPSSRIRRFEMTSCGFCDSSVRFHSRMDR